MGITVTTITTITIILATDHPVTAVEAMAFTAAVTVIPDMFLCLCTVTVRRLAMAMDLIVLAISSAFMEVAVEFRFAGSEEFVIQQSNRLALYLRSASFVTSTQSGG